MNMHVAICQWMSGNEKTVKVSFHSLFEAINTVLGVSPEEIRLSQCRNAHSKQDMLLCSLQRSIWSTTYMKLVKNLAGSGQLYLVVLSPSEIECTLTTGVYWINLIEFYSFWISMRQLGLI
jgi:hypothetical protein